MSFFDFLKKHIVHILSCCDRSEKPLQIGHPTDFRRTDITMEGLTEEQQAFIRDQARKDVSRIFAGCPPSPISPLFENCDAQHAFRGFDRIRERGRRLSAKFCGYGTVYSHDGEGIGNGSAVVLGDGKDWVERDSATLGGSEREGSEKGSGRV